MTDATIDTATLTARRAAFDDWLARNCATCLLIHDCDAHAESLADYFTSFERDWTLPLASAPCVMRVERMEQHDERD